MGRPPTHGAPSFRFFPAEVAQMEALLREHGGHVPAREVLMALADRFSNSSERSGKITVQMKQVWNWFQNRRYALRSKLVKAPGNPNMPPNPQAEVTPVRNVPSVPQQTIAPSPSGHNVAKNTTENPLMEFEAKSARDGAWYDVQAFHSHRYLETGNPEVLIRFSGFGPEEDEWVNVRKHVRQRSLPCESSECVAVLPGDLILCFQEGKEQALYFDAHVLDAQRRRHDVRGCRCRFLVRYDHDQSEEIVPLRKVCRRPETDYRLQVLHAANESASASVSADSKKAVVDPASSSSLRVTSHNPSAFTKSGNLRTSATEAFAENIINPGAASEIVEVKKEEGQNLESSMFAGSNISQGETSDNPSITIPGSEKPGVIEPIEQAMAVSTATTGSSPIVSSLSTKAESSNQAVSAEDTKE
uniref:Homeobox domain-containing protein n=1 Tax=Chenopodium quinoa TaxID=63459 RepID=A0A803LVK3_CHEQI